MKMVIAFGAENKSTFAVMTEKGLYLSKVQENLSDINNLKRFENDVNKYIEDNNIIPDTIACDYHPDYISTGLAEKLKDKIKDSKLVRVQHHFAHIVSCMLDNNIDEEVIGISFDGTGYGADGHSWGGEVLVCTRKKFKRLNHLRYVAQPGGDIAAREGWRMAVAYLEDAYGEDVNSLDLKLFDRIGKSKTEFVRNMIEKDVNSPLTSSIGRLFDAVSSIIGICDVSEFEAEAAILLEKAAQCAIDEYYSYEIKDDEIDLRKMTKEIVNDLKKGIEKGIISAKFHNTLGEIIFDASNRIKDMTGIEKVLVSGGCFQNKYLMNYIKRRFENSSLELFTHNRYSTTDLGISAGQAAVAVSGE